MNWKGSDVISARQFTHESMQEVFDAAGGFEKIAVEKSKSALLEGKILATLFLEPSTRTQFSFQTAMVRLGGSVIGCSGSNGTSIAKGESLQDTMKLVEACANAAVLRHPTGGAAALAAEASSVPVINAGDGANEHPTQSLVDLYTVQKEKGKIDGVEFLVAGDLKHARTVRSLLYALCNYDVEVSLYSPPGLELPQPLLQEISGKLEVRVMKELNASNADVVYATRIQKERFAGSEKHHYEITLQTMQEMKRDALLLHPLPKVGEIAVGVEKDCRAAFYRQEANGVPVRMALLAKMLA